MTTSRAKCRFANRLLGQLLLVRAQNKMIAASSPRQRVGIAALGLGVVLWSSYIVQSSVACVALAPVPVRPPKIDPALPCQLQALGWFVWCLLIPVALGVFSFRSLGAAARAAVIFGLVLPACGVWV